MTTRYANVHLWGGILDGLKARIEVGQYSGPPRFVDVPTGAGPLNPVLKPVTEQEPEDRDVEMARYFLDMDYAGTELRYCIERKVKA